DHNEDAEIVVASPLWQPSRGPRWTAPALLRAALVEPLGGQHHDEQSGPVGDGIAEERAPVRALVPAGVKDDPQREHRARRQRQGMVLPEGLLVSTRHGDKAYRGLRGSAVVCVGTHVLVRALLGG